MGAWEEAGGGSRADRPQAVKEKRSATGGGEQRRRKADKLLIFEFEAGFVMQYTTRNKALER